VRAATLAPGGSRREIATTDALLAARAGALVVVGDALTDLGYLDRIIECYLEAVADVVSPTAADRLHVDGLERLHDVCTPDRVAVVLTEVDRRAREFSVPLARALVGAMSPAQGNRYFLCPRLFVRAQVPVRELESYPGLLAAGHLGGSLRPVGLHRDHDLTHPAHTLSLSAAIGRVEVGNSVAVQPPGSDAPVVTALAAGDLLVFDADLPHATVPNETDETRVSVTARVVLGRRLAYGPGTHWRPYADARLLDGPWSGAATLQSRLNPAALRRWRWRRGWEREQRRADPTRTVPSVRR